MTDSTIELIKHFAELVRATSSSTPNHAIFQKILDRLITLYEKECEG